jgi:peptidoglycan/xylan/chitin deacetylase (PgdA/CDA1 family)
MGADAAVTVVLPVVNREASVARAMDSVLAQAIGTWRLVLVYDASTAAASPVAPAGDIDPRVGAVSTEHRGASAARNAGLDAVNTEWVLFLDQDAWLSPEALQKLLQAAAEHPDVDCVFAGWTVVTASGSSEHRQARHRVASGMNAMVAHPPFPLFCAISRTEALRSVGAFDLSLRACEDWDLWLRLARAGARFFETREHLAWHRIPAGTASTAERMLSSGLTVIDRVFAADQRVTAPLPEYRNGASPGLRSEARTAWCAYAAGLSIGAGETPAVMLATLAEDPDAIGRCPETIAYELYVAVPTAKGEDGRRWWRLSAEVGQALDEFVVALEGVLPGRGVEARVRRQLEDLVFPDHDLQVPSDGPDGVACFGRTLSIPVELASPLHDQRLPDGLDRLHCRPAWRSQPLARVTIAASDGIVPGWVMLDACVAENAWILAQLLMREGGAADPRSSAGRDVPDNWEAFLRQVWGCPEVTEDAFYDPEADAIAASVQIKAHPGECPVIDVCGPLPQVLCPGIEELELEFRVAGEPSLRVPVAAQQGRITANALVAAVNSHSGFELCRAVVRRVLERGAPAQTSIRQALIQTAALLSRQVRATRVGQRVGAVPGTAGFRAAVLPAAARSDLSEDAAEHGEPVTSDDGSLAGVLVYDPTLLGAGNSPACPRSPEREPPPSTEEVSDRDAFESLFASSDDPWGYSSPYEVTKYEQTLELVPEGADRVLELACAAGHFTRRLAVKARSVDAVDVSELGLAQARRRCQSVENVNFRRADLFVDDLGSGYDCVICSEVLYYAPNRQVLGRAVTSIARALRLGGMLITAHANALVDDPGGPGVDWDVPFGAKGIEEVILANRRFVLARDLRTDLYRIQAYRRRGLARSLVARDARPAPERVAAPDVLPAFLCSSFRPHGGVVQRSAAGAKSAALPILMYHRVAPTGAPAMRQWRVTPEELEEQLSYLTSVGYHSVTLEAWRDAVVRRRTLPGKPIALTFDDGYADFDAFARPLLDRHGFQATLFVVTDRVGTTNTWDSAIEEVPLMDWDVLRRLSRSGFAIGSHTATHPHLTAVSDAHVVRELARSRRTLLKELGHTPKLFAAPYGLRDSGIDALIGACGFELALTCDAAVATLAHQLLRLPRLEVTGGLSLAGFVRLLGG